MHVDEAFEALRLRGNEVDRLGDVSGGDVHAALVDEEYVHTLPRLAAEGLLRGPILRVCEGNGDVVERDLAKLVVDHVADGIADAHAGDQQRRAAADADDHHHQTLFVAKDVADGELVHERQPPPQRADALEQNALASLGRGGAQKLRRGEAQFAAHGEPRGPHRAEQRRSQRQRAHAPIKHQFDLGKAIHDTVRHPDDLGEDCGAKEETDDAADGGGAAGIEDEFAHDGARSVAHGLEYADLRALLIDHARHRGHAHQRRHHEEEQREDHGDALDDLRIALEAGVADVGGAVQHIDVRLVDLGDLFPRVGDLAAGVGQFALGLHKFAVGLFAAILVFRDAVGKLHFGVLQFGAALGQFALAILDLGKGVAQFGAAVADLAAGGGKLAARLLAAGLHLRKAGFQLRHGGLQLLVGGHIAALLDGVQSSLHGRELFQKGRELGVDGGEGGVVGGLVLGELAFQLRLLRLRGGDPAIVIGGGGGDVIVDALQRRTLFGERSLDLGAALGVGRWREGAERLFG